MTEFKKGTKPPPDPNYPDASFLIQRWADTAGITYDEMMKRLDEFRELYFADMTDCKRSLQGVSVAEWRRLWLSGAALSVAQHDGVLLSLESGEFMNDQNEMWKEAIRLYNLKEHTQDGRDLLMKNFIIQRR